MQRSLFVILHGNAKVFGKDKEQRNTFLATLNSGSSFGEFALFGRVDPTLSVIAEQACRDTWRNIRDDLKAIKLAQLLNPNGTVWQVTEPSPDAANRLKSLDLRNPPPILDLV